MHAIILAAGMGKRLKELTKDNTKCMVSVSGVTLIERMLTALDKLCLNKIVIVVGYEGQKLIDFIATLNVTTPIIYVNNPVYNKTNNIYSLGLAKNYLLEDDTILLESDLIFEESILQALVEDKRKTLALVDKYETWMDGTCIKLDEEDNIIDFVPKNKFDFAQTDQYYKTVNIYKFAKEFSASYYVPFLEAYMNALGNNEYYEQVLRVITMLENSHIKAKRLTGQRWYEIDDAQDLDIAESLFAEDDEKRISNLQGRYGGYWRYPKMLDFCYLVNPYFPPQKLVDEIQASFSALLTQYPSGMRVNSLLAAKNFGVKQSHVVIGNGAAELIKCFMEQTRGQVGFIRPTFEEYPNRYCKENSVVFVPNNENFSYTSEDIKNYFDDKDISTLVLINPDNPSGNFICRNSILSLAEWCKDRKITLLLDESFIDFAEGEDNSLFKEDILAHYTNLVIMKSISKSYGVPGLRLGVLASSNEELITHMKQKVSIWNINSFAEFYMQIFSKYETYYVRALEHFKETRKLFIEELSQIKALRLIPTQANYVMAEICGNISATELTKRLLLRHNLLIKDLSKKIVGSKQFVRLAIRTKDDNTKLVNALRQELMSL